ncbi:hypothetical protein ACE6ED_15600 [Paenibacillus sp. CN-4]|uniref:hypothetical protein n=1 Tax=Paenibacillus nanchangensis TaxID=3348343 RepID=UPI00397A9C88
MTIKKLLAICLLFLVGLTGCNGNSPESPNGMAVANDEYQYNLIITNNSPLFLKSVVVALKEKDDGQINALMDSNINHGEAAKFRIENGKHAFKITLNPKNNYSVSKEFSEVFEDEEVVDYQIIIEENEVVIAKKLTDGR